MRFDRGLIKHRYTTYNKLFKQDRYIETWSVSEMHRENDEDKSFDGDGERVGPTTNANNNLNDDECKRKLIISCDLSGIGINTIESLDLVIYLTNNQGPKIKQGNDQNMGLINDISFLTLNLIAY